MDTFVLEWGIYGGILGGELVLVKEGFILLVFLVFVSIFRKGWLVYLTCFVG